MLTLTQLIGFGAGGSSPITYAYAGVSSGTGNLSQSWSIGAAAADRFCIMGVTYLGNTDPGTISSPLIDGVTPSTLASVSGAALYGRFVSAGTSVTFAVNYDPGAEGLGVQMTGHVLHGVQSATPYATQTGDPSAGMSIAIAAGGAVVGIARTNGIGGYTWTNLTERADAAVSGIFRAAAAADAFADASGGLTITAAGEGGGVGAYVSMR